MSLDHIYVKCHCIYLIVNKSCKFKKSRGILGLKADQDEDYYYLEYFLVISMVFSAYLLSLKAFFEGSLTLDFTYQRLYLCHMSSIIILVFVGIALILLVFRLFKKDIKPFPKRWEALLNSHVHYYRNLSTEKKIEFKSRMMLFLSEVNIEGIELEIEDLDKVLISASAIIPVFGFSEWHYNNLDFILLYPEYFGHDYEYIKDKSKTRIAGMVGTGHMSNRMILSRQALRVGFSDLEDQYNTAIHEFVHLIDMLDGKADGIPLIIMKHQYTIPWIDLIHKKIEDIYEGRSDIRPYGATNQAEFLSVVSEYFFERPELLKETHPELYQVLAQAFQQDLAKI